MAKTSPSHHKLSHAPEEAEELAFRQSQTLNSAIDLMRNMLALADEARALSEADGCPATAAQALVSIQENLALHVYQLVQYISVGDDEKEKPVTAKAKNKIN